MYLRHCQTQPFAGHRLLLLKDNEYLLRVFWFFHNTHPNPIAVGFVHYSKIQAVPIVHKMEFLKNNQMLLFIIIKLTAIFCKIPWHRYTRQAVKVFLVKSFHFLL